MSYTFQRSSRIFWTSGFLLLSILLLAQTAFAGTVSTQDDITLRINDNGGTARDIILKSSSSYQMMTVNDATIQFNLLSGESVNLDQTEGRMFETNNTAITNKCVSETLSQLSFTAVGTTTVNLSTSICAPTGGGGGGTESTPTTTTTTSAASTPTTTTTTTPTPTTTTVTPVTPAPEVTAEVIAPISAPTLTPPPVSPVFKSGLGIGMTNDEVKRLQILLATDSVIYPEGITSGYFGSLTKAAVGRFQLQYDVVSSESDAGYGYVGPKTRAKLQEVYEAGIPAAPEAPAAPVTPPSVVEGVSAVFTTPLDIGMQNADVKRLQTLLASDSAIYPEGITSGYFGSLTKAAVGRFQMKHGLVSSVSDAGYGYVGPKTRAKLQEVFEKATVIPIGDTPLLPDPVDAATVNSLKAQIESLQKLLDQLKTQ